MSNLWFNIRFGTYHWQWGPDGMTWKQNQIHVARRNTDSQWRWFELYCIFGVHL